jgi:S1-C subfamily serine protease
MSPELDDSFEAPSGLGPPPLPPPPQQPPAAAPPPRLGAFAAAAVVLLVAGAAAGAVIGHAVWAAPSQNVVAGGPAQGSAGQNPFANPSFASPFGPTTGQPGSGAPGDVAAIAAKVAPAIVDVNSQFGIQHLSGEGSGIVLDGSGLVLTNNHVIDGSTAISVSDNGNGKSYDATVVGYDPSQDIALLQLQGASGLASATIGDSSKLSVGEAIVGIGNAGGTGGTTPAGGSVTALNQSITATGELNGPRENLTGMIQVNAGIEEGDSGGPLVDSQGQVLGMDTAGTGGFSLANTGYAIPIDTAMAVVKQIESGHGTTLVHVGPTAFLGITVNPPSGSVGSGSFGNAGGSAATSGVTVGDVLSGEPAQKAGLNAGDVITSLGGQSVGSEGAISAILLGHHPGESITIAWTAGGAAHTATLTLASGPPA